MLRLAPAVALELVGLLEALPPRCRLQGKDGSQRLMQQMLADLRIYGAVTAGEVRHRERGEVVEDSA